MRFREWLLEDVGYGKLPPGYTATVQNHGALSVEYAGVAIHCKLGANENDPNQYSESANGNSVFPSSGFITYLILLEAAAIVGRPVAPDRGRTSPLAANVWVKIHKLSESDGAGITKNPLPVAKWHNQQEYEKVLPDNYSQTIRSMLAQKNDKSISHAEILQRPEITHNPSFTLDHISSEDQAVHGYTGRTTVYDILNYSYSNRRRSS